MTESEFYIWLGQKFKTLRENADLTIAQVARRINVSRGLLSQFENDGKKISAFRINQLLKVFKLSSLEDLLDPEKKNELQITVSGSELMRADKSTLKKIKETIKYIFSSELYDSMVDEMSVVDRETPEADDCKDGKHCQQPQQLPNKA